MLARIAAYFTPSRRTWLKDVSERTAWTAAQVALSAVVITAWDLPTWVLVPVGAGLAWLKGVVARHVGDPDTAAIG